MASLSEKAILLPSGDQMNESTVLVSLHRPAVSISITYIPSVPATGAGDAAADSGLSELVSLQVELKKAILLPSGDQTGYPRPVPVSGSESDLVRRVSSVPSSSIT